MTIIYLIQKNTNILIRLYNAILQLVMLIKKNSKVYRQYLLKNSHISCLRDKYIEDKYIERLEMRRI